MSAKTAAILTGLGLFALFFGAACLLYPVSEVSVQAGQLTMLAGVLFLSVLLAGLVLLGAGFVICQAVIVADFFVTRALQLPSVLYAGIKRGLQAVRTRGQSKAQPRQEQLPLF